MRCVTTMTEEDEKVEPASYSPSDEPEHDAIHVLHYILNSRVKSHIGSRDKTPNHDDWVEIVDKNGVPIGNIWVQVKKLPEENLDPPKRQIATKYLSYYDRVSDPFFIIVVDTVNEIAYWHHVTKQWFVENDLGNQKNKTITFSKNCRIKKDSDDYLEDWESILTKNRDKIENYELYQNIKNKSNPAIGVEKPEFKNIHTFLDEFHELLDTDFEIISRNLYPSVWRFGFGSINYSRNNLEYTLYPIYISENDAQIREIDDSWDAVHNLGSSVRSGTPHDNPIERAPEKYAYNVIEREIDSLISERRLDYSKSLVIASEYIYRFVSEYAPLLGLDKKDTYEVSKIRDGYYRYLQYFVSEELGQFEEDEESAEVIVSLRGFLHMEGEPWFNQVREKADQRFEQDESDPPIYNLSIFGFNQSVIEHMIDTLVESGINNISKSYLGRDFELSNGDRPKSFYEGYSDEAVFENVNHYYSNLYHQYRHLADQNFPSFSEQLQLRRTNFLVVILDMDNIQSKNENGWSMRKYWLKTNRDSLRVEVHCVTDEEVELDETEGLDGVLNYKGEKYEIFSGSVSGKYIVEELIRESFPLVENIHEELRSDLRDYLHKKRAVIQHPERETDN